MKKLNQIIEGVSCKIYGNSDIEISEIIFDSRQAGPGKLFVAQRGTAVDGHDFISQVIEKGVRCIICEQMPDEVYPECTFVQVEDSHLTLGLIASNFFDKPSSNLKLIGVTGTNGKTSIATLLHRLFTQLGYTCGLLSTVKNLVGEKEVKATHTTPDSVTINSLMADMVAMGCEYAFMEVSSHAIDQKRIAGLDFDGAVFTNITHDHLDYHKTFDEYIRVKKAFFDGLKQEAFAITNLDDKRGSVMVQNTKSTVKSYSLRRMADYKGKILESHFDGMLLIINDKEVWTSLIGNFNASNLLAVYGVACELGQNSDEILQQISTLRTVAGRFEYVRSNNGITAVVDYAHTPDALKNVIQTINQIREGGCQLITVVGAGGNRDKTKRPEMAKISVSGSDKVVITSDNPRFEEPGDIIKDMLSGVEVHQKNKVLAIEDRKEAIRTACMLAQPGDIVLIAGKGHENYQEVKGVRSHFDDKEVVTEIFMLNQINEQ